MKDVNGLVNPFPGLRAFEEEEDILFFGREKQVDELLRKLRTSRFLAIIGSSGSGKSSLVKSGLLPSLHSGLMSGVGSQWRIALFRPGNDPIGQLNEALCRNGILRDEQSNEDQETNLAINGAILRRSNIGLIEAYRQSGLDKRVNLLVLVDQFEELFRFSKYEKESGEGKRDSIAFVNLLLKAAEQKEVPIYVVFTMRSDFLGDCTGFRGLPEAINDGQYLVPRMTRDERREAITGPIAVGGGTITQALVNRLLNDVGDNPDQLPILQHALMRTWDIWKKKGKSDVPIDIEDYETAGTISEALSQHAEEAFAELSSDRERLVCEVIFKELTDKGGLSSGIRRPRMLSELCAAADAGQEEVVRVIEIFRKTGRGFLMPASPAPLTAQSIIDISHESIMRVWKRLITWLEEEEESAQVYMHLCEAVDLYETGKGGLWRDPELQIALKWKEEQNKNAAWASRYNNYFDKVIFFLDHSRQQRDLELKHKEELQKQRLRMTRRITIVVSVLALIAFIIAAWAFNLKIIATSARKEAEQKKNEALVQKQKAEDNRKIAEVEKKNAEIAKDSAEKSKEKAIMEEKNALFQKGIAQQETKKALTAQEAAERSKDEAERNKKIAEENADRAKKNADEADKNRLIAETEKEKAERLRKVAESRNNANTAIRLGNDTAYKNEVLRLSLKAYMDNQANHGEFQDNDIYSALYLSWQNSINDNNFFRGHDAPVRSVTGIPNSNVLVSADEKGRIIISKNNGGILTRFSETRTGGEIRNLVVDVNGTHLLAVMVNTAVMYNINGDHTLKNAATVKFSGVGRHGAFLGGNHFLVQTSDGVYRFDLGNPSAKPDSVRIFNCSSIAVSNEGKIFIGAEYSVSEYSGWDGLRGAPIKTFRLPNHVTSVSVDKSGRYLAAGTYAGGVWFKDLTTTSGAATTNIHRSAVNDVRICVLMDGRWQLATASSDKTVKLIEIKEDHKLNFDNTITLTDHTNWVYSLYYSADGKFIFSGGEDARVFGRPTTMKYIYDALSTK